MSERGGGGVKSKRVNCELYDEDDGASVLLLYTWLFVVVVLLVSVESLYDVLRVEQHIFVFLLRQLESAMV